VQFWFISILDIRGGRSPSKVGGIKILQTFEVTDYDRAKASPSHGTMSNEISRVGERKQMMEHFSEYSLWDNMI
jgi:hypothetical protein